MSYRKRYAKACLKALEGFELDYSKILKKNHGRAGKILELTASGMFSKEIAEVLCVTPKTIQKFWRRQNFPNLHNLCPPQREERHDWKGGIYSNPSGHLYSRTPGHPYARKHGSYVAIHRLVMEKEIGRYLEPCEVVHHIDGDPGNNDIKNLELYASNAEHLREELSGRCPNWSDKGRQRIRQHALDRSRDPITKRFL